MTDRLDEAIALGKRLRELGFDPLQTAVDFAMFVEPEALRGEVQRRGEAFLARHAPHLLADFHEFLPELLMEPDPAKPYSALVEKLEAHVDGLGNTRARLTAGASGWRQRALLKRIIRAECDLRLLLEEAREALWARQYDAFPGLVDAAHKRVSSLTAEAEGDIACGELRAGLSAALNAGPGLPDLGLDEAAEPVLS
ncbi:MAG: hypothetical protein AMXMBFR33_57860 [Candidatus Xenobia bacterium]